MYIKKEISVLGQCYLHQSKYVAIVLLEECLALQQKYPSANAVKVANTMRLFGSCFMEQNKLSVAERLLRDFVETKNSALLEGHPDFERGQLTLAQCLHHQGKVSESIKLKECVRIYKSSFHLEHRHVAAAVGQLGYYLLVAGHLDKSEKHLENLLL
ncbi:uncharacterized protein LOC134185308 [Corticium candelabrum]|uniref:uncharacterized protein LOC134185308 n=1 Tax=Corticium candelabrum TaxID=121492 RepID=UPI002E260BAF|nr:uncharacterized protein LOC134185308 [Corticium candelabrum]